MAYTERYVSALAGGGGDGSVGSPWTWEEARVACVPGTRVNVKADGTYSLLANEGTTDKHYMTMYVARPDAPICWRGYTTTPGDGGCASISMGEYDVEPTVSTVMLMISPPGTYNRCQRGCWSMLNFNILGRNGRNGFGVMYDDNDGWRTRPLLINVHVHNSCDTASNNDTRAVTLSGPVCINCTFSVASVQNSGYHSNVFYGDDWAMYGCVVIGTDQITHGPNRGFFSRCLFKGSGSGTAIYGPGYSNEIGSNFEHCVFDGFALVFDDTDSTNSGGFNVRNCIFRNCAKIFLDTSATAYRHYFIYGNKAWNASGDYNLFDLNSNDSDFGYASNDMWPFGTVDILADDPFVDAENGDYRVTSASGCIDAALPLRTQYGTVIGTDIGMVEVVAEEDYPAEEDVRKDVDYKNGIYTGTLELPAPGDVRDGTDYDAPTAEQTGTCHVPAASDVRSGVDVDDTTGTCHVPAAADVRVDVDVDDTVGTCVVPDPEDVKRDVPVDATVGTFDARRDIIFKDESSVG